jgi:hypothetical protein
MLLNTARSSRQSQHTARSSRPRTPLTEYGSPGFFYDENQKYDSPALSSNKQSPPPFVFSSPETGYQTAESETPSPPRNVMIAESV